MKEFVKGQIVYMSNDGLNWFIRHYIKRNNYPLRAGEKEVSYIGNTNLENALLDAAFSNGDTFKKCLSIEDYHKMRKQQPKHMDFVSGWDNADCLVRLYGIYDKGKEGIISGSLGASVFQFENYEVIPKQDWPDWAHEVRKKY